MARTIVLAAPAKQLSNVVGHSRRRRIYDRGQPVWEDRDGWREETEAPRPGVIEGRQVDGSPK